MKMSMAEPVAVECCPRNIHKYFYKLRPSNSRSLSFLIVIIQSYRRLLGVIIMYNSIHLLLTSSP